MSDFEYIRKTYRVPAKRGAHIEYAGRRGVVTGTHGPYIKARLDGDELSRNYHPTDLKWLTLLVFTFSLLFTGVVEAKEVVIQYDDFLKMLASKEHSDKLKNQCAAEKAIYVKLNDENTTIKKLNAEQLQAVIDENETRKKLGETQEQINEALQKQLAKVTQDLDREKRLSRYKSEAFYLATAIFLWVVN